MMVRTFAEEVYFQLVGAPDGVAAAVAVTLPVWAASALGAVWLLRRSAWLAPAVAAAVPASRHLRVGRWVEVASATAVWVGLLSLVAVPLAGLILKAGSGGSLSGQLVLVIRAHGATLADSLLWSAVAGLVAAALALAACRRARGSPAFAGFLLALTAVAWVTPAPLVGLGLKTVINLLLAAEDAALAALGLSPAFPPLRSALYDQPSPLPAVWALVVRFFPVAVAVLWPAVRQLPQELLDAARLDGGRRAEWRGVVWPLARGAVVRTAVAVAALGLGDVVASKLAQPPGRQSFAEQLFAEMHYGADATVAAMSLLQVATTALVCGAFGVTRGSQPRSV
jgi:iron(III) transport system permease protein